MGKIKGTGLDKTVYNNNNTGNTTKTNTGSLSTTKKSTITNTSRTSTPAKLNDKYYDKYYEATHGVNNNFNAGGNASNTYVSTENRTVDNGWSASGGSNYSSGVDTYKRLQEQAQKIAEAQAQKVADNADLKKQIYTLNEGLTSAVAPATINQQDAQNTYLKSFQNLATSQAAKALTSEIILDSILNTTDNAAKALVAKAKSLFIGDNNGTKDPINPNVSFNSPNYNILGADPTSDFSTIITAPTLTDKEQRQLDNYRTRANNNDNNNDYDNNGLKHLTLIEPSEDYFIKLQQNNDNKNIETAKKVAATSQGLDDALYALKSQSNNANTAGTTRVQKSLENALEAVNKAEVGAQIASQDTKDALIKDLTNKLQNSQNYAANNGWNNQATYDAAALNGYLNPVQNYTSDHINNIKGISNLAKTSSLATTPITAQEMTTALNTLNNSGAITKDAETNAVDINQKLVPSTKDLLAGNSGGSGGTTPKDYDYTGDGGASSSMGYSLEDALATTREAINNQLTDMYGSVPTFGSILDTYNNYYNSTANAVNQTNDALLNQLYDSQGSTMANLAKVLRSNRQSGLTSGANTGAINAANALSAQNIANEQATAQQTAWNNVLANLLSYRQKQNDIPSNAYNTINSLANAITEALGNTAGYDLYGDIAAYRNNT